MSIGDSLQGTTASYPEFVSLVKDGLDHLNRPCANIAACSSVPGKSLKKNKLMGVTKSLQLFKGLY